MKAQKIAVFLFTLLIATTIFSCKEKDDHVPPALSFASGAGYTSADASVTAGSTVKIGIVATKTEDDMKTVNVSLSINGGASTSLYTYPLTGAQQQNFAVDYTTQAAGSTSGQKEKYIFTVTDNDGNITSSSITLTVL